jgi:methionine-rich copper-binding protein CopC
MQVNGLVTTIVVEGIFAHDCLIASCPSEVACIKKLTQAIQIDGGKKVKKTN